MSDRNSRVRRTRYIDNRLLALSPRSGITEPIMELSAEYDNMTEEQRRQAENTVIYPARQS